jgi:hypothetical protein
MQAVVRKRYKLGGSAADIEILLFRLAQPKPAHPEKHFSQDKRTGESFAGL